MSNRKVIVEVKSLHKTYPGVQPLHVLKGCRSEWRREMVALMGASGSGKSTLLNILRYSGYLR